MVVVFNEQKCGKGIKILMFMYFFFLAINRLFQKYFKHVRKCDIEKNYSKHSRSYLLQYLFLLNLKLMSIKLD